MSSSNFSELGLSISALKAIQHFGYEQPTPIQAKSIPILMDWKNLLGTAQTGTGKTAAFALPLISRLDNKQKSPQVLIVTPTRELTIQVAESFHRYAKFVRNFHVAPIYGGADMRSQLKALKRGVQVVVGTPGRLLDHISRRSLDLSDLRALVLDEADEMLRMGFIDDVETILSQIPETCQRALFSATMPGRIRNVTKQYIGDAETVAIDGKTKTVEKIDQQYITCKSHQKMDVLTRFLEVESFNGMIIFVRTKSSTIDITERLQARGYSTAALNGDLNQSLRERTINRLKKGQIDILVATDVAARGLDVDRVSHVINFDIPYDNESYVHRIGRTGRAGKTGKAILFITPKENRMLRSIERSTRQKISLMVPPSNKTISDGRIKRFFDQLSKNMEAAEFPELRSLINDFSRRNNIDMSDIAAALAYQSQKDLPILLPKDQASDFDVPDYGSGERKRKKNSKNTKGSKNAKNAKNRKKGYQGKARENKSKLGKKDERASMKPKASRKRKQRKKPES